MTSFRSIVALAKDSLRGVVPAELGEERPTFEWVDPRALFVEDAYQREFGERGIALARKIVAGFSWSKFKAPICVRLADNDGILVCIDGQHTAIGAASHPGIAEIPVMIVTGVSIRERAAAFVGHNRDRIGLTQMAIWSAEVASGDALAVTMAAALRTAGATILTRSINLRGAAPVGATIAVGTIRKIAKEQGEAALARVLTVLVKAGRGPIKAGEIAAAAAILEKVEEPIDDALRAVIASKSPEAWAAAVAVETIGTPLRKFPTALAALWAIALGEMMTDGRLARSPAAPPARPKPIVPAPAKPPAPKPAPVPKKIVQKPQAAPPIRPPRIPVYAAPGPANPPPAPAGSKRDLQNMLAAAVRNTAKTTPEG